MTFPVDLSEVVDHVDDALAKYVNDIEAKIGIDDSAVTTSLDYRSKVLMPMHSMARQAIINGNFDVWQRLTTVTNPAASIFTADRWLTFGSIDTPPTNIVHSRQAQAVGDLFGSYYFYRIAPDGAGSVIATNSYGILQKIEHGTRYLCGASKTVTVSFYARSSIADKKLGIYAVQRYGSGGSPTANETINGTNWTLTTSWVKYTHTFTTNTLVGKTFGTANDDNLQFLIGTAWGTTTDEIFGADGEETMVGSGNIDIAQIQLCAGDVALPFQPKSYEDELRACQRYFIKDGTNLEYPCAFISSTTTNAWGRVTFPTTMRDTPTVLLYRQNTSDSVDEYGTGAVAGCTAVGITDQGFSRINTTNTWADNAAIRFGYTATSEL